MTKKMLTASVILVLMGLIPAGCKDNNAIYEPVEITNVPSMEVSYTGTEKEIEPDNPDKGAEDSILPEDTNGEETNKLTNEQARELLMAFLEGQGKCRWKEGLNYPEGEYDINEFINSYNEKYVSEPDMKFHPFSALYGFIDCGKDKIEEMVLLVVYEPDDDSTGMGPATEFFFLRANEGEVQAFGVEESYYRVSVNVYDSGYIVVGGSSGAASYDNEYYVFDAEGEKFFLCSMTDTYIPFEPYISYYDICDDLRPDDYPVYSGSNGEYLFPQDISDHDYLVRRLNFTSYDVVSEASDQEAAYSGYAQKNLFFIGDADGYDIDIPDSYKKYYEDMGLKVYNLSETHKFIVEHIGELGLDDSLTDGEAISWNDFTLG